MHPIDFSNTPLRNLQILAKKLGIPVSQISASGPGGPGTPPTSPPLIIIQANDEVDVMVIGTVVYNSAGDHVKRALAGAMLTKDVVGIVLDTTINPGAMGQVANVGVVPATPSQWDAQFGTVGGLTVGTRYFLSPFNYGQGTATPPNQPGQYRVPLGIAISTTELQLDCEFQPILL